MTRAANLAEAAGSGFAFRNRIINGDMRIDQRNAGAAISSVGAGNIYTVDRWSIYSGLGSVFKAGQNLNSVTPPAGFSNYVGVQNISTSSTNINTLQQTIEGFNFADFNFGSSNAKAVTISFWVYSSLSGLFGGTFLNAAQTRIYPFSFTIASANTWQYVSITIPGDTSGTWVGASNAGAAALVFCLGGGTSYFTGTAGAWITSAGGGTYGVTGQVNLANSAGATFYVTGVQFEKGTSASPFEFRMNEMDLCKRYYQYDTNFGSAYVHLLPGCFNATTNAYAIKTFMPEMRTLPSVAFSSPSTFLVDGGTVLTPTAMACPGYSTYKTMRINATVSGGVSGQGCMLASAGSGTALITYSAEL